MATRAVVSNVTDSGGLVASWEGITEADTGAAIEVIGWDRLTVQVLGDFDASGAITMQGSNDGTTWATLNDVEGAAVVLTAASIVQLQEHPRYVRPTASAGTAVDMDVYLVGSK